MAIIMGTSKKLIETVVLFILLGVFTPIVNNILSNFTGSDVLSLIMSGAGAVIFGMIGLNAIMKQTN